VKGKIAGPFHSMRIEVPLTSSTISSKDASEKTQNAVGNIKVALTNMEAVAEV